MTQEFLESFLGMEIGPADRMAMKAGIHRSSIERVGNRNPCPPSEGKINFQMDEDNLVVIVQFNGLRAEAPR